MLKSLRSRLIASFVLIVLITLVAAGAALYTRLGGYREQLNGATLRQVAAPIYYNVALTPRTANAGQRLRSDLVEYLRLEQQEAGVTVLLLDKDGAVIRESTGDPSLLDEHFTVPPPPQRGPNFATLKESAHVTNDGRRLLYVTVPMPASVRLQPAGVAGIVIALPESAGPDVFRDLRRQLLFAGGVGLAAALLVALVLWASLYRPLGRVAGGVRAVARGDFRQRIPVSGPSEVRTLAADVNSMADSVQTSQRALRDFLANVSHELKTPLTSIRGFSQAMIDGTMDTPEERASAARIIDAESRRLLHLVGELLDLSRIESGQQSMNITGVRVSDVLSHIREVFAVRAEEAGLEVRLKLEDGVVAADFDRIEQVLGNLVDNAFRHAPRGTEVTIGARSGPAGFMELYVTDFGHGIAPEDAPHVFDRFYRSADESSASGAGLGLAISREIVRAHGGEIRAESHPDTGTTFAFTLPLAPSNATMTAHPNAGVRATNPHRLETES